MGKEKIAPLWVVCSCGTRGQMCGLPVMVRKRVGDYSNPGGRLDKNSVGVCRVLSFAICFFKVGKLIIELWLDQLVEKVYPEKKMRVCNIWRPCDNYEHQVAEQLETFNHAL